MKSKSFTQTICTIYLVILFVIYPLYQRDHYYDMGYNKYIFYLLSTIVFLVLLVIFIITDPKQYYSSRKKSKNKSKNKKKSTEINTEIKNTFWKKIKDIVFSMSNVERCVWLYLIFAVISYIFGIDKYMGFWGADGWQMGLLIQCLMISCLFVFAKIWEYDRNIWIYALIGSFLVFILGILNRFSIDPLGNYEGLDDYYIKMFLSTIGQSSWYGAFLCTLFPIGVAIYFITEEKKVRKICFIYLIVASMSLVTQNSEAAYIALAGILMMLLWFAFEKESYLIRFLEIDCIVFGSFILTGLLQKVFEDWVIDIDDLSFKISQGVYSPIAFVISLLLLVGFMMMSKKGLLKDLYEKKNILKVIRVIYVIAIILSGVTVLLFIILNTTGALNSYFDGEPLRNQFLYFDDNWGTGRGVTWKTCGKIFAEYPFWRKLIGIGPDSLEAYVNYIDEYREMISRVFQNDLILSCAHNEFYNSIICYGLLGGIAYISIFISAIIRYIKNSIDNPTLIIGVLCIVSYIMFNFFCYQTVVCTPFVFVIIGVMEKISIK